MPDFIAERATEIDRAVDVEMFTWHGKVSTVQRRPLLVEDWEHNDGLRFRISFLYDGNVLVDVGIQSPGDDLEWLTR